MEPWYSGAVVDAVREAKTRRALFIVYVRDDSDQSQSTDQLWSTVWLNLPDTNKMVALRLSKDTEACSQFMAIYKVQIYPTIYFINGQNGQIIKKVDHQLENANQLEQIITESLNIADGPAITTPVQPVKTVEDKVAEARERLKELHEKREEEEKEKEKQEEMSRRRLGQQMLSDKQKKDEELLRKRAEELRRDKLEQQQLQDKLKAQIQQDREDKRRKYEQEQTVTIPTSKPKTTTTEVQTTYTRSRLQFRLTDGSFFTEDFACDAHMNDVYAYLQETLPTNLYKHGSYVLRTPHTRVTLTRDNPSTLKQLELVPSAVLLVITRGNTSSSSSPSTNLSAANIFQPISLIFAWFMMQVNFLYQLISTKLFGVRPAPRQTPTRTPQPAQAKQSQQNFRADSKETSTIRRFHNTQDDSDDEEKRTWNGNSTEQL